MRMYLQLGMISTQMTSAGKIATKYSAIKVRTIERNGTNISLKTKVMW